MNANPVEVLEQLKTLREEEKVKDADQRELGTVACELWYRERHR